jgi:hypothetical protein
MKKLSKQQINKIKTNTLKYSRVFFVLLLNFVRMFFKDACLIVGFIMLYQTVHDINILAARFLLSFTLLAVGFILYKRSN